MFKPQNDRVIVKRDDAREVSKGGIIIPEQAQETPSKGTVIRVGTGEKMTDGKRFPLLVAEGDRVIFNPRAGLNVLHDEPADHLLIRECDILCVVEE